MIRSGAPAEPVTLRSGVAWWTLRSLRFVFAAVLVASGFVGLWLPVPRDLPVASALGMVVCATVELWIAWLVGPGPG